MDQLEEITTTDLRTETDLARTALTVKMIGSAESQVTTDLDRYLKRLHAAAVEAKVPEVVVDMRALDFMNSSCFKTFVTWINTLQEAGDGEGPYRVRFLADDKKHWQGRSLGALACFAVDLIRVES